MGAIFSGLIELALELLLCGDWARRKEDGRPTLAGYLAAGAIVLALIALPFAWFWWRGGEL